MHLFCVWWWFYQKQNRSFGFNCPLLKTNKKIKEKMNASSSTRCESSGKIKLRQLIASEFCIYFFSNCLFLANNPITLLTGNDGSGRPTRPSPWRRRRRRLADIHTEKESLMSLCIFFVYGCRMKLNSFAALPKCSNSITHRIQF